MPNGLAGFPKPAPPTPRQMTKPLIVKSWVAPSIAHSYLPVATGVGLATTKVHCAPLMFDSPVIIEGWYTKVATLQAASAVQVGLYTVAPGGRPDQLIVRLGSVDSTSAGDKQIAINPTYIPAGPAYAVFLTNVANVAMVSYSSGNFGVRITDPGNLGSGGSVVGLEFTVGFTALPERFTGSEVIVVSDTAAAPVIAFLVTKVLPS